MYRGGGAPYSPAMFDPQEPEAEVAERFRIAGTLARRLGHDLNNLLTVITSVSTVLTEEIEPGSPHEADLEDMIRASRSAQRLVRQLMQFPRSPRPGNEPYALHEAVDAAVKAHRAARGSAPLVEVDETMVVVGDRERLGKAVFALLDNAVDAGDGPVTVRAERQMVEGAPQVRLRVVDSGCGMDSLTLSRAFRPFYTSRPGDTASHGLGLVLVREVAREHGGRASLDSELGEGTTAELLLPLSEAAPTPKPKPLHLVGACTVLVVDDEPSIIKITRRLLKRRGFDVVTALSGQEALHIVATQGQGLAAVLLDVVMPEMDGFDVLAHIRLQFPSMPVLMVSGHQNLAGAPEIADDPLTDFLAKPFDGLSLAAALTPLIEANGPVQPE